MLTSVVNFTLCVHNTLYTRVDLTTLFKYIRVRVYNHNTFHLSIRQNLLTSTYHPQ
jgi:hypothetical protein